MAYCKVRTADERTHGLTLEMKIALILADIELSIYELRENILPDFDRCPKEAPLLSQVL